MAKYLRPRRGAKEIAIEQNFILKSGEFFLEFPNGSMGNEPGRIVIGNNLSSYSELNYAANNTTNEFQPFITDPSIYVPRFEDSTPGLTPTYNFNAATEAINEIGNGSTSENKLPDIIGAVKKSLCKINDNVTALNTNSNNKYSKHDGVEIYDYALRVGDYTKINYVYLNHINGVTIYGNGGMDYTAHMGFQPDGTAYRKFDIIKQEKYNNTTHGWAGTTQTSLNKYLTETRVKHQQYTFTFPTNANTYYEHYYYDIPYTTIGVPTSNVTILGAFVANVSQNYPAFLQCVENAFRVYSKYADIKGKTVTIRVTWEEYTTTG